MKKRVLITGASRGLGYEFTKAYILSMNYEVFSLLRTEKAANRLKKDFGASCHPIITDIGYDNCQEEIRRVLDNHSKSLDILINNAGDSGKSSNIESISSDEVIGLFNVHCMGVGRVIQATLPYLGRSINTPKIINISSRLGSLSKVASGEFRNKNFSYSYRIAKASQNMLTVCLAQEFREKEINICVVAIHPGEIKTESGDTDANLKPYEAIRKIIDLVEILDLNDSGRFIDNSFRDLEW